jgi:hypothetical protein
LEIHLNGKVYLTDWTDSVHSFVLRDITERNQPGIGWFRFNCRWRRVRFSSVRHCKVTPAALRDARKPHFACGARQFLVLFVPAFLEELFPSPTRTSRSLNAPNGNRRYIR